MDNQQHIGVCVLLLNSEKTHILLGKRLNSYKSGAYGMPGGRVEVGEELIKTAERELLEETGLHSKDFTYIGVIRDNQETFDFIHFVYVCNSYTGEPEVMEPEKCEKWEWFPLDNLPKNVHQSAIDLYKDDAKIHLIDSFRGREN